MKDKGLRDRLKSVQAEIEEQRGKIAALLTKKQEAKDAFAASDAKPTDFDRAEFKDAQAALKAHGEAVDELNDLQAAERNLLEMLGEDAPAPSGNGNGPHDLANDSRHDLVASLLGGDAYQALRAKDPTFTSKSAIGTVALGRLGEARDVADFMAGAIEAAEVTSEGKQGAIAADRRGMIQPNLKPLSLLDLIPTGTTESNSIEYVQVTATPAAAAEVAPGTMKPEESFTTVDASAPVRTIAGWIKLQKQALADVQGLESIIRALLPYDVKRRTEAQLIAGNGVGQNLKGILKTAGIGVPAAVPGDNRADTMLRAMTAIFLADGDPNFVTLHPLDWQELLLMRENEKDRTGGYLYGTPSSPVAPSIWGLAMTQNRAVPQGEPLVGDSNSASLLYREGMQILISDSDGTDFRENRVTILAEVRVAAPIWRPSSFAKAPEPSLIEVAP
jgi:HK97 family phage major capsid protein